MAAASDAAEPVWFRDILVLLAGIGAFAFWLWMIVDCVQRCPRSSGLRLTWLLVIVLVQCFVPVGAVLYYFFQRPYNPP